MGESRKEHIKKITSIGGSALIEGIMMRGPKKTMVAVRSGKEEIYTEESKKIMLNTYQEKVEEQTEISETVTTEENSISEEELTILAEEEVRRFKESYGVDIKLSEMKKQLILRDEYEAMYGSSYELEEIFLSEQTKDDSIGDPGTDEYELIILQIQEYVKKYNIDESRYASMTAKEELEALEIEYGPLDGVKQSEIPSTEEDSAEIIAEEHE